MYKKMIKTIILVVFLVFIGIVKVDAEEYEKQCVYTYVTSKGGKEGISETNNTLTIGIRSGKNEAEYIGSENYWNDPKNWTEDAEGFNGHDYYAKDLKCPPYLVVEYFPAYPSNTYFSDDDHLNDMQEYADGVLSWWRRYKLIEKSNNSNSNSNSNSNRRDDEITDKTCVCNNVDSSKRVSVTLNLSKHTNREDDYTIYSGINETDSENILNFDEVYYDKSDYIFVEDLQKNDKCPAYALYAKSADNKLLVSDEKNVDILYKTLKDDSSEAYKLACTGSENKPYSNSNSNSKSNNSNIVYPGVDDPTTLDDANTKSYSCGKKFLTGIPSSVPTFGKFIYSFIQFIVPLILIILGSIDLIKSITGGKEDEIKKGQQIFIKRLISGAIVFFALAIVKLLVGVVFPNSSRVIDCVNCIIGGHTKCTPESDNIEFDYNQGGS